MDRLKRIFVFAGEPSGDLHGSHLVRAMREKSPYLSFQGVSGPRMRKEGIDGPLKMEDFEVMGISDVVRSLPRLYRHFRCICNTILYQSPDIVVLIDYPGFNLRLAQTLRKRGYCGKIVQYISPSVWAWGKHRIEIMAKALDLLLTIYPFEAACFSATQLSVEYVGSPIKEYMARYRYQDNWKQILGIPHDRTLISLFPGSRQGEIVRNLPVILETVQLLKKSHPQLIFGISCADITVKRLIEQAHEDIFLVPPDYTYELMRDSHCAIAKSGTVTLELALHGTPTVVIYKLSVLNRWYAQHIAKVNLPHYCIVNILAGKQVFPELIANGLSAPNLYRHFKQLLVEGVERDECIKSCRELSKELGTTDAHLRAAQAVLSLASC